MKKTIAPPPSCCNALHQSATRHLESDLVGYLLLLASRRSQVRLRSAGSVLLLAAAPPRSGGFAAEGGVNQPTCDQDAAEGGAKQCSRKSWPKASPVEIPSGASQLRVGTNSGWEPTPGEYIK